MKHIAKISVIVLVIIAAGLLLHSAWTEIVLAQFSGPGQGCGPGGCGGAVGASSTSRIYVAATSSAYYSIGASGTIYIVSGGLKFPDGTTQTTASGGLYVAAGYVTPGDFNSVQGGGGNYTFPGSLGVGTSSTPFTLTLVGSRGALYSNAGGWYQYNAAGTFRSAFFDDNSTTHIYGDGNGTTPAISIEAGNVGVATTTPAYRLVSMQGSGGSLPGINIAEQNTTNRRGTIGFGLNSGATSGWIIGQSSSNNTTKDFYFYDATAALNRVVIDTAGNFGIATTTPAYKLTVVGGTYNNTVGVISTDTVGPGITLNNTGASGRKFDIISTGSTATPGAGYFAIYDETAGGVPGYRFVINPSGNVGIATTSPVYPLTVAGVIHSSTGGFRFPDGTTQTSAYSAGSSGWTDNGTTVTLTTGTDNIGLGVTPTDGRIQINATGATYVLRTSGSGFETYLQHITNAGIWYTNGTSGFTLNNQTGPLIFNASNVEVMRLSGGNMLIGNDLQIKSDNSATDPGNPWMRSDGNYFVINPKTGSDLYLAWDSGGTSAVRILNAVHSPVYYDSNNTGYYMDPASTSNVNTIQAIESYASSWFRSNTTATGLYNQITGAHWYSTGGTSGLNTYYKMNVSGAAGTGSGGIILIAGYEGTNKGYLYTDSSNFGLLNNAGSWAVQIPNGGVAVNILGTLTVGGGTGKVNAGTIDPLYTIDGKRYATYVSGMVGQKEETTGTLTCKAKNGSCTATIDFAGAAEGSDIWLFGKTTNISKQFERLTVLLTPAFDGRVWYEKNASRKTVIVHAEGQGNLEISYRLAAPRFDAETLGNRSTEATEGFNLDKLIQ